MPVYHVKLYDNKHYNVKLITQVAGGGGGATENTFIFEDNLQTMYSFGKYQGSLATPVTIPAKDKTFKEMWDDAHLIDQAPTITQPSVSVAIKANGGSTLLLEVGTSVTPSWTSTFNPGNYQYGPVTGVTASAWAISDNASHTATTQNGSFPAFTVVDNTSYRITSTATHGEGAIPKTNRGTDYPAGKIQAGTKTATSSSITGFRKLFYGYVNADTMADFNSAVIRALTGKANGSGVLNLAKDNTHKGIIVAAPTGTRVLTKATQTTSLTTDVTSDFVKQATKIQVSGVVAGQNLKEYDIWWFHPASMATTGTFQITMA